MTFDEWFTERRKQTTFFKAGICEQIAKDAFEAATMAERAECASLCEGKDEGAIDGLNIGATFAAAIRMRSNEKLTGAL